jgi:bifunctional oligoribonuclease and PAP phosphatase NrnA
MNAYGVDDWNGALDALRAADEVVLACHVNPDGDALGSLLALSLGLRRLGKKTLPTWGTADLKVPHSYGFLPGVDSLVDPGELPENAVTFVALDCGAADRLGDLEKYAIDTSTLINIDHHPGNDDFGTHNLVVTTVSSTAELVARLLQDLEVEIDRDIATCLYTGVVTDTGRFQYSNSTPETLRLAADLLERGIDAQAVAQEVFESSPFNFLKLIGRVLDRAVLIEDEAFVYSWFTRADLEETGVPFDETEKLIDLVRQTRAARVAAMFKENDEGNFRVSLRSKGPESVGAIARELGGGGHELAAGLTADSVEQGVADIRRLLAEGD